MNGLSYEANKTTVVFLYLRVSGATIQIVGIFSFPSIKEGPMFPMLKEISYEALKLLFFFLLLISFREFKTAFIMAAAEILLGHFTQLGKFLSKL